MREIDRREPSRSSGSRCRRPRRSQIFAEPGRSAEGGDRPRDPRGGKLSCYRQGDFIDLCRGPHVPSTGKLGVFKLTHSAGAYWKGDERNPMLQRIYGASFLSQKELDEHLARMEAARDAGPPEAGQGARALHDAPAGAGLAVLPAEGDRRLQRPRRLRARALPRRRLHRGRHAADLRRRALQDLAATTRTSTTTCTRPRSRSGSSASSR